MVARRAAMDRGAGGTGRDARGAARGGRDPAAAGRGAVGRGGQQPAGDGGRGTGGVSSAAGGGTAQGGGGDAAGGLGPRVHTPLLDPVRTAPERLAEGMRREPPRIPMLSNVTGSWLSAAESQDANHWCEHMCRSLRFEEGIGELLRNQEQVLLEVGPGAGLGAMVRQHPRFGRERTGRVLSSLPGAWERVPDRENVAGVMGRLWVEGVDVDWEGYYAGENRRRLVLSADLIAAATGPGWAATTGDRPQPSLPPDRSLVNSDGSREGGFHLGQDDMQAGVPGRSAEIARPIGPYDIGDSIEVR